MSEQEKQEEVVRRTCPSCMRMQDFIVVIVEEETPRHIITRTEERCTVCGGIRIVEDPRNSYRMR